MSAACSMPEESLLEALRETDLISFQSKLCDELQLTRLEHFDHITDGELRDLGSLSQPAVRRLRVAIDERRSRRGKVFGTLFGTTGRSGKTSRQEQQQSRLKEQLQPRSAVNTPNEGTCLIAKEQLRLMEKLGEGSFAVVRRAVWTQQGANKLDVAVKLFRDSSSHMADELQQEVNSMHRLRHPNLIKLHGLVFSSPVMMVVELCEGGSLLDRLRDSDKTALLALQLLEFALQISKGMAYLETKRYIHRDLAARNVLLTKDEKHVKIGDFGLTRALPDNDQQYVMSAQKKVPFAWCPPESLRRRQFSHASDVWSFGVTVWEIFTDGTEPWCGFRGPEILKKLSDGERLLKPEKCPMSLYQLLLSCWAIEPDERPRFITIYNHLQEFHFSIGECREAQSEEGLLKTVTGDRIIVVEGSPEHQIWYGQNARTRHYGRFRRRALVFRSDGRQRGSRIGQDISRPLMGSFVHAGHGDLRGGQSWGVPDKIDQIYLDNPMPMVDAAVQPLPSCLRGPAVVPSILDLSNHPGRARTQTAPPAPIKPPPNVTRRQTSVIESTSARSSAASISLSSPTVPAAVSPTADEEPDPFAPFDDDDEEPTAVYDRPPSLCSATYQRQRSAVTVTNPNFIPTTAPTSARSVAPPLRLSSPSTVAAPTVVTAVVERVPQAPIAPVPVAVSSSTASTSYSVSAGRLPSFAPPTTTASLTSRHSQPILNAAQHRMPQDVLSATQSAGNSSPPSSMKPQVRERPRSTAAASVPTSMATAAAVSTPMVVGNSFLSSEPDPFEISSEVKQLAHRSRYSEMLTGNSTGSPPTSAALPTLTSTPFQPTRTATVQPSPQQQRPVYDLQASFDSSQQARPMANGAVYTGQMVSELATRLQQQAAAGAAIPAPVSGSTYSSSSLPRTTTEIPSRPSSSTAALTNANSGRSQYTVPNYYSHHSQTSSSADTASNLLLPTVKALSTSVPDVAVGPSSAKRVVLDMFDPLSARPKSDTIAQVRAQAPFASADRCARVLRRCADDVQTAVRELKAEKLVDMGLVPDRDCALSALTTADWDVNAAAERLLG